MAMLIVLILLAVGTIVGSSLLREAVLAPANSSGFTEAIQTRYCSESGLEHAGCLLLENAELVKASVNTEFGPYNVDSSSAPLKYYFTIAEMSTPGYFSVSSRSSSSVTNASSSAIYRHSWGRQTKINHAFVSTASAACYTSNAVKIYGDAHSNFIFYNLGNIVGNLTANSTVTNLGTVNNGSVKSSQPKVDTPTFDSADYINYAWGDEIGEAWIHDDSYFERYEDVRKGRSISGDNPAGVVIVNPASGNLTIRDDFEFKGSLFVNGNLIIEGDDIELESFDTFPALVVTGGIYIRNNTEIDITGVVYAANGILPYNSESYGSHSTINGALICNQMGYHPYLYGNHQLIYKESYCSLLDPSGYGSGGKLDIYGWSR